MSLLLSTFSHDAIWAWPAAAAFLAGGIINAIGSSKIRASFVQLGFPGWWCRVTGALEIATALLLFRLQGVPVGIALGAVIMATAIAAILRARLYRHLPSPFLFLLLLVLAGFGAQA